MLGKPDLTIKLDGGVIPGSNFQIKIGCPSGLESLDQALCQSSPDVLPLSIGVHRQGVEASGAVAGVLADQPHSPSDDATVSLGDPHLGPWVGDQRAHLSPIEPFPTGEEASVFEFYDHSQIVEGGRPQRCGSGRFHGASDRTGHGCAWATTGGETAGVNPLIVTAG